MSRHITAAVALLLLSVTSACGAERGPTAKVPASSCYLVEVSNDEEKEKQFDYGRQLVPYFNRFAANQGLSQPDGESGGGEYVYRNPSKGTQVSLTLGMGERRALAALYTDKRDNCSLCKPFENFLRDEVNQDFKSIPCGNVEGFRLPELWNVDLRE